MRPNKPTTGRLGDDSVEPAPIGDALRARAAQCPQRPALVAPPAAPTDEATTLTFGQVASLAHRLIDATGGTPGSTIALLTQDRVAQASIISAALMAGCIICPINPDATPDIVSRLLRHSRATLLVTDPQPPEWACTLGVPTTHTVVLLDELPIREEPLGHAAHETPSGGLLVYTSGTTGHPKGVYLSEANIGANVSFAIQHYSYDEDWVSASVLPLFHTFTIISDLLPMLVCGGKMLVTPGVSLAKLRTTSRAMATHRVRSFSAVPIIFDTLMALRFRQPDSMRFTIAGAAPLGESTRTRYAETYGHPILPAYGLTETTCFAAASSLGAVCPGAVGRAAGIQITVLDEAGEAVDSGDTGEIALMGPSVIREHYFDDGGKNDHVFLDAGWFLTGDMGHLDANGFLFVTGRKKNMLIRGGEKVYLEDVDRCLATHPAVLDCCTARVGTSRHQDQAVAFIVSRETELDKQAISDHVVAALGVFSRLDDVVLVPDIPRSPSGKAQRVALVAAYKKTS
jgi:acyl-CoA synthetase (AMP-forming)/AMP-acid ligase II